MAGKERQNESLPACVTEYINLVVRKIKYRHKVRQEVRQELTDHFTDALAECQTDPQRQQAAEKLIADFGDPKTLATLIRRGKKRCRPLWKKFIIRSFQAVGLFIIMFCFYTWWFVSGTPTIRVDYVAQLNQFSRPEVADEDNAWPHYEKAMGLYVEPNESIKDTVRYTDRSQEGYKDYSELNETEQKALWKWMEQNQPAWNEYVTGSQKPYCWIRYNAENNCLLEVTYPKFKNLRDLARMSIWQSRILALEGHLNEALEKCLVTICAGKHFQKETGTLVEQFVGLAFSKFGHHELLFLNKQTNITLSTLEQIQKELEQIYDNGYPLIDIETERLFFLDTVQRVFTRGGIDGGHIIPKEVIKILGASHEIENPEDVMLFYAQFLIHARRDETIAKGNEFYDQLREIAKMKPYKKYEKNITFNKKIGTLSRKYYFVRHFMPALERAGALFFEGKATHEATLTVLALRRWQLEKGVYPEKLEELVTEGYLRQLPEDPYSDGILRYEKRGDDFILYSLGRNFIDDGGVQHPEKNFEWGDPEKIGDRVFWPVSDKPLK